MAESLARSGAERRALITGASGFVGQNLTRALLERGWQVQTFSRRPPPPIGTEPVPHFAGDVRDRDRVNAAVAGVDVVFHLAATITLAAENPEAWEINVIGPATVARAALDQGVERFLHCSSVHAFDPGAAGSRVNERGARSGPTRPVYDRSKAAGEVAVRDVMADGLQGVFVNPTGIIGPIDTGPSRMNRALLSAARGRLPVAIAGGFDWVDVRDVVSGMIAAAHDGEVGENYLLSGQQATVLHVARLAAGMNGRAGPLVAMPQSIAARLAPLGEVVGRMFNSDYFTPASVQALLDNPIVDRTKAEQSLGYSPRPLEDTVRDLIWSWRDNGMLKAPKRSAARSKPARELAHK